VGQCQDAEPALWENGVREGDPCPAGHPALAPTPCPSGDTTVSRDPLPSPEGFDVHRTSTLTPEA